VAKSSTPWARRCEHHRSLLCPSDEIPHCEEPLSVSAALPRALQAFADIRVVIPGYSEVLAGIKNFSIVGQCPAFAGLPAFEVGLGCAGDGLPYYVVVCPGLFERVG
jgi:hypothetical protein